MFPQVSRRRGFIRHKRVREKINKLTLYKTRKTPPKEKIGNAPASVVKSSAGKAVEGNSGGVSYSSSRFQGEGTKITQKLPDVYWGFLVSLDLLVTEKRVVNQSRLSRKWRGKGQKLIIPALVAGLGEECRKRRLQRGGPRGEEGSKVRHQRRLWRGGRGRTYSRRTNKTGGRK